MKHTTEEIAKVLKFIDKKSKKVKELKAKLSLDPNYQALQDTEKEISEFREWIKLNGIEPGQYADAILNIKTSVIAEHVRTQVVVQVVK